jgi:hypothetical protein
MLAATKTSPGRLQHIWLFCTTHSKERGGFHNLMAYHRIRTDTRRVDEDTLGRAFWALAQVGASSLPEPQEAAAKTILDDAMPALGQLSSSRGIALALLGLKVRNTTHPQDSVGSHQIFPRNAVRTVRD